MKYFAENIEHYLQQYVSAEIESKVWGEYQKNKTSKEKGDTLLKVRKEREKISAAIMARIKGLDLDYMIPREAVLPITRTEVNLTEFKRLGLDESKMQQQTTGSRTNEQILNSIK